MKIRKPLKHKGYIMLLRRSTLLLKEKKLDFAEYGFYIFLLQEVDWSKRRSTYGHISKTNLDLALDSGCDPSTISRRKEGLRKLGLIEINSEGLTKVINFEKFTSEMATKLSQLDVASLQEDIEQTQSITVEMQQENAYLQQSSYKSEDVFSDYPSKGSRVSNDEDINLDDIPF